MRATHCPFQIRERQRDRRHGWLIQAFRSITGSPSSRVFCVHACGRLLAIGRAASTARSRACASSPVAYPLRSTRRSWPLRSGQERGERSAESRDSLKRGRSPSLGACRASGAGLRARPHPMLGGAKWTASRRHCDRSVRVGATTKAIAQAPASSRSDLCGWESSSAVVARRGGPTQAGFGIGVAPIAFRISSQIVSSS